MLNRRSFISSLGAIVASSSAKGRVKTRPTATIAITIDAYRSAYYNFASTMMADAGLVGTFFAIPENIDRKGPDSISREQLRNLRANGWEIGAYTNSNMCDLYRTSPAACFDRLATIDMVMREKGFPVRSIAPMQRAWRSELAEMARGHFDVVRVVDILGFQTYPVPDPLYLSKGGSLSLSVNDTAESLCAMTDAVISAHALWVPNLHEVGAPANAYSVDPVVLMPWVKYCRVKVDAGELRLTTLSEAMTAA